MTPKPKSVQASALKPSNSSAQRGAAEWAAKNVVKCKPPTMKKKSKGRDSCRVKEVKALTDDELKTFLDDPTGAPWDESFVRDLGATIEKLQKERDEIIQRGGALVLLRERETRRSVTAETAYCL